MKNDREMQVHLLIQRFGFNNEQVKGSVILDRIEQFSGNSCSGGSHNNHSSHCQFSRDGGHGNVCYNTEEEIMSNEKSRGLAP